MKQMNVGKGNKIHEPFQAEYICMTCGSQQILKSDSAMLCNHCHNRIFRKTRSDHWIQHKAR